RRLRAGDVVGVVAPAGPVDPDRLPAGVAALEHFGLRPRLGAAVLESRGHLAGSDAARLADLQAMIADPEVRAVRRARGGSGSQRLVPALDLAGLRADPKPVIGYSDTTALHGALAGIGLGSFHGPMVATDLARGLTATSSSMLWATLAE